MVLSFSMVMALSFSKVTSLKNCREIDKFGDPRFGEAPGDYYTGAFLEAPSSPHFLLALALPENGYMFEFMARPVTLGWACVRR